ncbi:hypothetical protein EVAR_62235_1 [Eumeta japonica]|uniref:Uncharacterized protein n=1 Tax=Eumeta variegata TaxID=151549 RepID=A0A4C1ZBA9_EUMVA|nr:hypothetical protein EVAR_62235_1 [Eumeta japonica]
MDHIDLYNCTVFRPVRTAKCTYTALLCPVRRRRLSDESDLRRVHNAGRALHYPDRARLQGVPKMRSIGNSTTGSKTTSKLRTERNGIGKVKIGHKQSHTDTHIQTELLKEIKSVPKA